MVNSSPSLPNSVEEAYRQKCIELKKRLKDCETSNDLLVVRNHRLRRGIQRLRLERALLMREIERRIDPRMDDSDGTPSPPPTVYFPFSPVKLMLYARSWTDHLYEFVMCSLLRNLSELNARREMVLEVWA